VKLMHEQANRYRVSAIAMAMLTVIDRRQSTAKCELRF
jgi:hypothetical protein